MSTSSDEASDVSRQNLPGSADSTCDVNSRREPFLGQAPGVVNLNGTPLDQEHTNSASLKADRDTVTDALPLSVSLGANPESGGYDRDAIARFIRTLCAGAPGLVQTVRAEGKDLYPRFHGTDEKGIGEAISRLENLSRACAENNHLYIQISTCITNPNTDDQPDFGIFGRKRGGKDNVSHLLCLWNDIDYGQDGHADAKDGRLPNPPDAETAHEIYVRSGLPEASVIINSGGGLYELVLLDEPFDMTSADGRTRAESVAKRWQQRIEKTAHEMGYHYGAGVSNADRILRVPGTVNTKIWNNKRRATAHYLSDARYTFDDLEALINELHPEPQVPTRPDGGRITVERWNGSGTEHLPGTDFNNRGDWQRDILDPAGITYAHAAGNVTYWCRPGKQPRDGHSFSLGHKPDLLFSFTDGTTLPQWKYFDKFSAFAHLFHNRDFKAAAADLRTMGYGSAPAVPTTPPPVRQPADNPAPSTPRPAPAAAATVAAVPETPKPPPDITATEPDMLLDAGDPLVDTRMPRVTGTIRTSSDKKPYSVAQELRDSFFLHGGKPTLMRWQEMWVRWDGACWNMMSNDDVTSWLYQRMDRAFSMKKVDDQWTEVPWNPTNSSVTGLDKALRAAVNLRDDAKQNTMIGEGVHDLAVSCANGLLRVTGRELAPADPAFFTFCSVPFDFDRDAKCPQWEAWLADTFEHDPATVDMLQEWFGYVISGCTDQQKALMIQGVARSGKGTIARILQKLVGEINCAGTTLNSLTEQFGMWPLTDKTLAVIGDARLPKRGNTETITERLLSIIGEDTIQVDRKMQKPWQGTIPARVMLLSNEFPNWADSSGVLPTRFIVARTMKSYLGREDPTLLERLSGELPGILNWALDGLDRLNTNRRFTVNETTPEIVGAQQDRSSPQKGFVEEMCVTGDDKWVSKDRLREMWRFWNSQRGRTVADTRESFTIKILAMAPGVKARDQKKRVDGKLTPVYRGIGLLADHPELAPKEEEEPEEEKEKTTAPEQGVLPGTETPPAQPAQPPPRQPFPQQSANESSQNGTKPAEPPPSRPVPQHPDPGEP